MMDLNTIPSKETALKYMQGQTRHLLKVALEMFAEVLVNEDSDIDLLIQVRLALVEINQANLEKLNARRAENEQRVSIKHAETVMSRTENTQSDVVKVKKRNKQQEAEAWLAKNADVLEDLAPQEGDELKVIVNGDGKQ